MNQAEMPEIVSTSYMTTSMGVNENQSSNLFNVIQQENARDPVRRVMLDLPSQTMTEILTNQQTDEEEEVMKRIVRVLIVDSDENVPVDKSVLYDSQEMLTDSDDQELFFDVDIKTILEKHNAVRGEIVDPEYTDRTVYLEPLRIRELKMQVVCIAQF